jgi:DNA ligase-1
MTLPNKPMLAANDSPVVKDMTFPVLASPKTDGIRSLLYPDKGPVARSYLPIPNRYVNRVLTALMVGTPGVRGLDGELTTFTDGVMDDFWTVSSKIMGGDGEPDFKLYVFDWFLNIDAPFNVRIANATAAVRNANDSHLLAVPHTIIRNAEELEELKLLHIDLGYEGTMTRHPEAPYKQGRSTLKQEWLLKHKGWATAEGIIIGYEELLINGNEQTINALGEKARGTSKKNKRPGGTLGAVILDTDWGEVRLGTGKGFSRKLRDELWEQREPNLGKFVTFKYMPYGTKNKPRLPGWVGFRDPIDMSE